MFCDSVPLVVVGGVGIKRWDFRAFSRTSVPDVLEGDLWVDEQAV